MHLCNTHVIMKYKYINKEEHVMKKSNLLLMLLVITALSSCNINGSNDNTTNNSSCESSSLASDSYSELLPSFNEDGWDDARVNYINPNPSLKDMSENVETRERFFRKNPAGTPARTFRRRINLSEPLSRLRKSDISA